MTSVADEDHLRMFERGVTLWALVATENAEFGNFCAGDAASVADDILIFSYFHTNGSTGKMFIEFDGLSWRLTAGAEDMWVKME